MRPVAYKDSCSSHAHYHINSVVGGHKKLVRQMLNESSEIREEYDIRGEFRGYSALMMDE